MIAAHTLKQEAFDPAAWLDEMERYGFEVCKINGGIWIGEPEVRPPWDVEYALREAERQNFRAIMNYLP